MPHPDRGRSETKDRIVQGGSADIERVSICWDCKFQKGEIVRVNASAFQERRSLRIPFDQAGNALVDKEGDPLTDGRLRRAEVKEYKLYGLCTSHAEKRGFSQKTHL